MDELTIKALEYHERLPHGKVSVVPTKPCQSAEDLSYAYTPGVAKPVLKIEENSDDAYRYTSKGNLVAVISNGTAILGLGDRGALASKPVMEGKGVLFKRFADIDVFDIEVDEKDPDKFIEIVRAISPTFGGINLEDIKGPECFYIEEELIKRCDIPVFHDDQHGTAIIASAGLINAAKVVGKELKDMKVVVNGAGAAGLSCAKMFLSVGIKKENLILLDKDGNETEIRLSDSGDENTENGFYCAGGVLNVRAGGELFTLDVPEYVRGFVFACCSGDNNILLQNGSSRATLMIPRAGAAVRSDS